MWFDLIIYMSASFYQRLNYSLMFAWTLTKAKNPQMWGVAENHTLNQWGYSWKEITKKRIHKLCRLLFIDLWKKKIIQAHISKFLWWFDQIKFHIFEMIRCISLKFLLQYELKKRFQQRSPPHPPSLTITSPALLFPKMLRILHFQNLLKLLYEFFWL